MCGWTTDNSLSQTWISSYHTFVQCKVDKRNFQQRNHKIHNKSKACKRICQCELQLFHPFAITPPKSGTFAHCLTCLVTWLVQHLARSLLHIAPQSLLALLLRKAGMWSRPRRLGLETYKRLVSVSSQTKSSTSRSWTDASQVSSQCRSNMSRSRPNSKYHTCARNAISTSQLFTSSVYRPRTIMTCLLYTSDAADE